MNILNEVTPSSMSIPISFSVCPFWVWAVGRKDLREDALDAPGLLQGAILLEAKLGDTADLQNLPKQLSEVRRRGHQTLQGLGSLGLVPQHTDEDPGRVQVRGDLHRRHRHQADARIAQLGLDEFSELALELFVQSCQSLGGHGGS